MSTTKQTQRIDFIDLAKGICIFLVVIGHCGAPIDIPGYGIVRMPLYFILSGLFFKTYGGGKMPNYQKDKQNTNTLFVFLSCGQCSFLCHKTIRTTTTNNRRSRDIRYVRQPTIF